MDDRQRLQDYIRSLCMELEGLEDEVLRVQEELEEAEQELEEMEDD